MLFFMEFYLSFHARTDQSLITIMYYGWSNTCLLFRNMWAQEPIIPDKAVYSFSTVTLLVLAGALVILGYAAYIKLACEQ